MKKKMLSALLCAAMVAATLTGCGGSGDSAPAAEAPAATEEAPAEEAPAATEEAPAAEARQKSLKRKKKLKLQAIRWCTGLCGMRRNRRHRQYHSL